VVPPVGRVCGRLFAKGLSLAGALPGLGAVVVGNMAGCPAGRGRDIPTSSILFATLYSSQIDARVQYPISGGAKNRRV
jgi:hypothetical protein